jgi:NAD(P)-dependent dehydrogenase (short-subunit alcohol dehydrogenase family)
MADAPTLTSARILVVGASAGIGRAFAAAARSMGAQVCVTARRADKLAELDGCHAIAADITNPDDCRRLVDEAVAELGAIDLIVHSAGTGTMAPIEDVDPATWANIYAVNVIGPTAVTAAALPHLSPDALVTFLSSESTGETRWGMAPYTATKSALDATIRSWRVEHPERRFQRIVMGATMPTDFGNGFGEEVLTTAFSRWAAAGVSMTFMETDVVGRHLAEVMAVLLTHPSIDVPDLCLDPRGEAWPKETM